MVMNMWADQALSYSAAVYSEPRGKVAVVQYAIAIAPYAYVPET